MGVVQNVARENVQKEILMVEKSPPILEILNDQDELIVRIHQDGKIEFGNYDLEETAELFWNTLNDYINK